MPVSDQLLLELQAIGAGDVASALQSTSKSLDALAKSEKELVKQSKTVSESFNGIVRAGRGLNQLGRSFDIFGQIFGNKALSQLGDYTRGIGELSQSFGNLKNVAKELSQGGLLSKLTLAGASVVGGAAIGSQIYDATIGKLQGTNTATILDQMRQIIEAGFNVDTLKMNVQNAAIQADMLAAGGDAILKLAKLTAEQRAAENQARFAAPLTPDQYGSSPLVQNMMKYQQEQQQRQAQARLAAMQNFGSALTNIGSLESQLKAINTRREGEAQLHSMKLAGIERDTQQQRASVAQQYAADLAQIEKNYYADRFKVAQAFGVEVARMEQDHQRDMRRMQQDHARNLSKLADSRDALAIEDEIENYNIERDRAEEDYNIQAARRNEDFALQLRDMEQAFQQQRDARTQQYQQQLQQVNQQATDRRKLEAQQWALLNQQLVLQAKATIDAINKVFAGMQTPAAGPSLDNYGGGVSSHAWGGYQTYTGAARMHAGEFVLNAQTTRAMEAVTGQRLSQTSVLNSTGGSTINLSIPMTVNGAQAQPEVFRTIVHEEFTRIIREATR